MTDSKNENIISRPFQWIGIGLFLWLSISGFRHVFTNLTEDLLILLGIRPILIFTGANILSLGIITIVLIAALRKMETIIVQKPNPPGFLLRGTVIAYILSQVIQFFYGLWVFDIFPDWYLTNAVVYYTEMNINFEFRSVYETGFQAALVVIAGIMVYRKKVLI